MTSPTASTRWTTRSGSRSARRRGTSVAGVSGGVGATTIATAIGAVDRGTSIDRKIDVLVCTTSGDSLIQAARAAQVIASAGRMPVLAVNAVTTPTPSRATTARLRLIEPHTSSVVLMPFVRRWAEKTAPLVEVRCLHSARRNELPRSLRNFARAVLDLRSAVENRPTATTRPGLIRPAAQTRVLGQIR